MIFGIIVHDPLYFEVGLFLVPTDPPYMSKNAQCAKFGTFWVSGEKNHLKVGVHSENNLDWKVGPNFFVVFYICWDYAISFSAKFPV